MGATIILFTILLIVLVGAALAYANRGGISVVSTQGARVYGAVLLKQSADYRNAYSRFVFDKGNHHAMTFNAAGLPPTDLFAPATKSSGYHAPPAQALTAGASVSWLYNPNVVVKGMTSNTGAESIAYVPNLTLDVCIQINHQVYGSSAIPSARVPSAALMQRGTVIDTSPAIGRSVGCFVTADNVYVFYSTLAES